MFLVGYIVAVVALFLVHGATGAAMCAAPLALGMCAARQDIKSHMVSDGWFLGIGLWLVLCRVLWLIGGGLLVRELMGCVLRFVVVAGVLCAIRFVAVKGSGIGGADIVYFAVIALGFDIWTCCLVLFGACVLGVVVGVWRCITNGTQTFAWVPMICISWLWVVLVLSPF